MKPKKRQKLCYNCEGEVDLDVIVCPFCAADLREEKPEMQRSSYVSTVKQLHAEPQPYKIAEEPQENVVQTVAEEDPAPTQSLFLPLALFTLGVQVFLLGLFLVLFSERGLLILKWDARLWFLYIFASIPLLIFGYRGLK